MTSFADHGPRRWCLGCSYPLHALAENRCPECGRVFDPSNPDTFSAGGSGAFLAWLKTQAPFHPLWVVPAMWILMFVPLFNFLLLPLAGFGVIHNLMRRHYWRAGFVALLAPVTVYFADGVYAYTLGQARIRGMGLPGVGYSNVDPELRCERVSGGCVVRGNEWVRQAPNNLAVRMMIRVFGPMPGAYTGPYPTEAASLAAAEQGEEVPLAELLADRINVGDTAVGLRPGLGAATIVGTEWELAAVDPALASLRTTSGPIRAARLADTCVALWIPTPGPAIAPGSPSPALVVLIDAETGRPFAVYASGQAYSTGAIWNLRWSRWAK